MSELYQQLKDDQLHYRKAGVQELAASLTTLIGEIQTEEKRGVAIDNAKVIAKVKKTISGLDEMIAIRPDDPHYRAEKEFLEEYIPTEMSEEEIRHAAIASGYTTIGGVMGYMKEHHAGHYDGKLAAKVIKETLG